ncbi:MAG: hypothetical protein RR595_07170 [Lysinibacillus sp.]
MKKCSFIVGFLLILGVFFTFVNNSFANDNTPPSQIEIGNLLKELKDKTEKYPMIVNSINPEGINFGIAGSQEYYNSVKYEVEEIVKNTIKSTKFEKYPVVIEKSHIDRKILEEFVRTTDLFIEIQTIATNYLSESYPDQFKRLILENGNSPNEYEYKILTNLDDKQDITDICNKMENEIYNLIETKLSPKNLKTKQDFIIKVSILNKYGEKIN